MPYAEQEFMSPRASLEAQHHGFSAVCQERFLSLLAFAYERAHVCSKQLDGATWITLQVIELAKHGPNADP